MASAGTAILALQDPEQESLTRVVLMGAGWSVRVFRRDATAIEGLLALAPDTGRSVLFVLDPARATRLGLRFEAAVRQLRARMPHAAVVLALADRERPGMLATHWATAQGAAGLVGRILRHRLRETTAPLLRAAGASWDEARVDHYATALLGRAEPAAPNADESATAAADALGADLDALAVALAAGAVDVVDRRWRTKVYPLCFTGEAATSWIAHRLGVARTLAEQVGRALHARGAIYHVVGEQPFRDGNFYYRGTVPTPRMLEIPFETALAAMAGPAGPSVADRVWRGLSFPRCFVGDEAAVALGTAFRLDFAQAVGILRALLELHVFRHVADAHDFFGTKLFYRFGHDRDAP